MQDGNSKKYKINWLFFLNQRGEADGGGGDGGDGGSGDDGGGKGGKIEFSTEQQAHIDRLINQKYKTWNDETGNFKKELNELRDFKSQNQKAADAAEQKSLEDRRDYDKLKENYEKQITDLGGKLSAKDIEIQDMNVGHALTTQIVDQGGYLEETLALLKGKATVKDGVVSISYVDENNITQSATPEEGVKRFLDKKPHLRKGNQGGGGGTGSGAGGSGDGGAGSGGDAGNDLNSLNTQLLQARNVKNFKLAAEVEGKIRTTLRSRGVQFRGG